MQLTNSVHDGRKSGQPSKRMLVTISTANPKFTAWQIRDESATTTTVSMDTARRVLRDAGLIGCVAIKKLPLSKQHVKLRLK